MTSAERKAWLSRYRLSELEVRRLSEEIARWESQAAALTARYGTSGGGGGDDHLQRAVEKMLELRDQLAGQLEERIALRREIEEAIAGVEDERLRELLRLRYLEGWTWEKIAMQMKYSYRQVTRLHERALEHVSRIMSKKLSFFTETYCTK